MKEYDLYIKVKPSIGLKEVSYAQDFLLKLVEKRELRAFCMENGVPHTDVYRMATGERQPGYYIILALRYLIPPIWWFVPLNEPKPKAKKMAKDVKNTDLEHTKGFKMLLARPLADWAKEGLDYQSIYQFATIKIKILTFRKMIEFSKKIEPQLWFVFED